MDKVRNRDDGSFVRFVEASGSSLMRTARLLAGPSDDAEDLVQTALERAYRNWSRMRTDVDPEPYVRRIIINLMISRNRRRGVLWEIQMAAPPEVPTHPETEAIDVRGELIGELRRLGARQRAVLVLRYWQDLSEAETAEILGCSVGTVKSQAARGLARLRRRMDGLRPSGVGEERSR
jgi:RNA polymerase sigma-70 factor (sigma-E family)